MIAGSVRKRDNERWYLRWICQGFLLLSFIACLLAGGATGAQEAPQVSPRPVKVGVYVSPPFVMEENGRFSGMAIDLWEALAAKLKLQFEYKKVATVRELVQATSGGEVDVAVTNLTITEERAQRIDFTHPWYDAGLRIMVNEDRSAGFWEVVSGLRELGFLRTYVWIALLILVVTVLLTFFDRWFDEDFPSRWRDGLAESFFSVMSVATGRMPTRKKPLGWIGRVSSGLWLVCGVAVVAYLTSTVTSVMTSISLTNQINSLADLPGKTVGVFTGSVAEVYARDSVFEFDSFRNIDEAVEALLDGRVAAIIGDAPVLEYYAHRYPDTPVTVVGAIFEPDKYGFGLARGSELTRPLTVAIIAAHESELLDALKSKYFSDTH